VKSHEALPRGNGLRPVAGCSSAIWKRAWKRQGARSHRSDSGDIWDGAPRNPLKARLQVRVWRNLTYQRKPFGAILDPPGNGSAGGFRVPRRTRRNPDRGRNRRLIAERIAKIEHELVGVKSTRKLHRDKPQAGCHIRSFALVGYTNAGKSTLFNRTTRGDSLSRPTCCFATLDSDAAGPSISRHGRPHHHVRLRWGFISDLPTMFGGRHSARPSKR